MSTIYLALSYLVVHFLSYLLYFRELSFMRKENGIFVFHLISVCILVPLAFAASLSKGIGNAVTVALAVGAAHGIYSLSFLELWSLAEGSYSFRILKAIEAKKLTSAEAVIDELAQVGDGKKQQRLASLTQLKLVKRVGDSLHLTRRGWIISAVMRLLRWLANVREAG